MKVCHDGELRHDGGLRARMARNLAAHGAAPAAPHGLKRAAVCLIVVEDAEGQAAVVITRRTAHLSSHAGQFAFPGGRVDEGESPLAAALREAREEIGLELEAADVLGCLDDYPTRSGYLISPIVAWAPAGAAMAANPAEVAAIHRVPIAELLAPGSPEFVTIAESNRPVIRYPMLGTTVHAPTAAVLYQFVEVAVRGRPVRVSHLDQPVFAWR